MIVQYKYSGKLDSVNFFVHLLDQAAQRLSTPDLVVPVPLHRRRLFQRTFNQSAILAQRLAEKKQMSERYAPLLMRRNHYAYSQKNLNPQERWRNVRNAFALTRNISLKNKHVWLIDDVVTTASTIKAATLCLNTAGAQVSILSLARVHGNFPNLT